MRCVGHAQNIHFPFDIEADTSISVATEMVVQLDLTDQDVTAIAEMIDAEIRSHIPDWSFDESVDNQVDDAANSESGSSEADDEISELHNDSGATNNGFTQEQLPSGRRYWSDSPRTDNEISHLVEDLQIGDNMSNGILKKNDIDQIVSDSAQQSGSSVDNMNARKDYVGTSCCSSNDDHPMSDIDEKLADLLTQQEEELNALRSKHKVAIELILNGVPAEHREETLTRCRLKAEQNNISDRL